MARSRHSELERNLKGLAHLNEGGADVILDDLHRWPLERQDRGVVNAEHGILEVLVGLEVHYVKALLSRLFAGNAHRVRLVRWVVGKPLSNGRSLGHSVGIILEGVFAKPAFTRYIGPVGRRCDGAPRAWLRGTGGRTANSTKARNLSQMPGVEVLMKPFALDDLEVLVRRLLA